MTNTTNQSIDLALKIDEILEENAPAWINEVEKITVYDLQAIAQGGCESGAYMPAVTYHTAKEVMHKHGDDITDSITDIFEDGIKYDIANDTWFGFCSKVYSMAVENWVNEQMRMIEDLNLDGIEYGEYFLYEEDNEDGSLELIELDGESFYMATKEELAA